jgi:hypothetical protein
VQPAGDAPFVGIAPEMGKAIGIAVVVAACWSCAPAQAGVVPLALPATSVPATAKVGDSVRRAVEQVPASRASAPADATVRSATAAAQSAVETANTTVQVAQGRAGASGDLHVGVSSLRRAAPARLRHPATASQAARPPRAGAPRRAGLSRLVPVGLPAEAPDRAAPSAEPDGPPPPAPPGPHADGGISAGAPGLFAGGLALLVGALVALAPRLRRRFLIDPAAARPVAFVALLERPG